MNSLNPGVLSPEQWNSITQAIAPLDRDQLTWISGYLAGLASSNASITESDNASPVPAPATPIFTVLYGSQTGNSRGIAETLSDKLQSNGVKSKLISMADYKPRQLKNETHLAVVVSTHGEGDAPDDAIELHEFLNSKKAPKLTNLNYAVLGLGDTSYEFFCQTGKDFDSRLSVLGANALVDRVDCDVDYEEAANEWMTKIVQFASDVPTPASTSTSAHIVPITAASAEIMPTFDKQNPFKAPLLVAQKITARNSVKDIQHIEISLADSGLSYQPGDALGVWFKNDPALVDELLSWVSVEGESQVTLKGTVLTIRDALIERLELTLSYPGFLKAYAAAVKLDELDRLLEKPADMRSFLADRQIIDIVRAYPATISAQSLADALRPMTPRLYSIASSQAEVEDEVHLTVAHVDYEFEQTRHQGGASGYLTSRLQEGQEVGVYIEPNDNFRLPQDPNSPIIMIGPGTGIAPFRAFMQEREATGADGQSWLFFGNPNFTSDFLYQTEWQAYLKNKTLSRISLAFSRDQADKIYVQDRLIENGKDIFEWLETGAYIYLCGDAMRMAKDVEKALLNIIQIHGEKSEAASKAYLLDLRKAKRYQKDVY